MTDDEGQNFETIIWNKSIIYLQIYMYNLYSFYVQVYIYLHQVEDNLIDFSL